MARTQGMAVQDRAAAQRTIVRAGAVLGVGIAGTLDEVIFHQLLQWHNFYVHTDQPGRIISDGLLHLFSTGLFLVAITIVWRHSALVPLAGLRTLLAGILMGAGGFNFYDGIIQHKILQLHPVRENVPNILPYDMAWNAVAVILIGIGYWLWRNERVQQERTAQ